MKTTFQLALVLAGGLLFGASACESTSDVTAAPDSDTATTERADSGSDTDESNPAACDAYPLNASGQSLSEGYSDELAAQLAGEWYLRFDIPTLMMVGADKICTAYTADDSPTRVTVSASAADNEDVFSGASYYAEEDVFVTDGRAYDGPYKVFARVEGR